MLCEDGHRNRCGNMAKRYCKRCERVLCGKHDLAGCKRGPFAHDSVALDKVDQPTLDRRFGSLQAT